MSPMTHLMFADDTLLLGQATIKEAMSFKRVLSIYENWSGQLIKERGLGFPDTQTFNQVLLCKQTWKLITEPNSYLSKVFKARDFLQGDFWSTSLGPNMFKHIWKLKVQSKVRHFVYKAIHNRLATSDKLLKRHVKLNDSNPACTFCGYTVENGSHLFHTCTFVKDLYRLLQIPDISQAPIDFRELYEKFQISLRSRKFRLWTICMWDLGFQRNRKFRGQPFRVPLEITSFGETFLATDESAPTLLKDLLPPMV
ncbi:hypothetical protein LIER_43520 [Lithospermum erythrorhizon]|uniref:Reverse transcriptase zinc-binding domain-containing protein n=1 Tax=Lithospermum erythrorhizon TaxID=34254 RepID=A0AAV3QAA0_LITER